MVSCVYKKEGLFVRAPRHQTDPVQLEAEIWRQRCWWFDPWLGGLKVLLEAMRRTRITTVSWTMDVILGLWWRF